MPRFVEIPALITLSGPGSSLPQIEKTLAAAGLAPVEVAGMSFDPHHNHGLPSYTDPITAHAAGSPNAGHTPGTLHPETLTIGGETQPNPVPAEHHGAVYEADASVAFLTVTGDIDAVEAAVRETPWSVRMHSAPFTHQLPLAGDELLVQAEGLLEQLREQVSGGR